jgi:endonuclease/exonuclease/phosphatase family metal-dependent hydrolase
MKLWTLIAIGLFLSLAACASRGGGAQATSTAAEAVDPPLAVMTFNLRFASNRPPNSWPQRRPVMRDCIMKHAPDLIGTQEGLYGQLKDLAADLPEYDWIGLGRDGGSRGEFMAIYYRRDRFEPLEYDHYWLSDTPDVMASCTWGHVCKRMVTWVKFLDRRTDQQFYFINTHLDHESQPAREKSAALILERTRALKTTLPILLVGDFNADDKNRTFQILTGEDAFEDTWLTAGRRINETTNTFHGYRAPVEGGRRIDWILSRGAVAVDSTEIITYAEDGQYPSDHFPVIAHVRLSRP